MLQIYFVEWKFHENISYQKYLFNKDINRTLVTLLPEYFLPKKKKGKPFTLINKLMFFLEMILIWYLTYI